MMIMISGCKDTKISENTHYPNYRKNESFSLFLHLHDFRMLKLFLFLELLHHFGIAVANQVWMKSSSSVP